MNLSDLAEPIAAKAEISARQARVVLGAFFDEIEQALLDGQEVKLGSVGKLLVKNSAPRKARSFGGKEIQVPAKRVVKFRPFVGMKQRLNPEKKSRRRVA